MILEALHLAVADLAGASLALAPPTGRLRVVIATPVLSRTLRISSRPSRELAGRLLGVIFPLSVMMPDELLSDPSNVIVICKLIYMKSFSCS